MTPGQVIIYLISPHTISSALASECLTGDEKSRASRFRFPKDAAHWSACRAALRQILGREIGLAPREVPLIFSEFGKPALAPPYDRLHFNLSHCPDLAIVALCLDGPVGVDLESLTRAPDLLECVNSFCHPEEIRSLPTDENARASQLLRIWTAKEAILKALGTGLSHSPELVHIHFRPSHATAFSDQPLEGIGTQLIHKLENPALDGYLAAIASPQSVNKMGITLKIHHEAKD